MEGLLGVSWVWWLLGTFGIAGTVALAIFAPTVLAMGAKVLGLLLRTRIGVGILVALVTFMAADIHRSRLDQQELEAQKAAFDRKQQKRDATIAADTQKAVDGALAMAKADDAVTDKAVEDFKHDLPSIPALGNPFVVGANACRLRRIAGGTCSQPESLAGVQTPRSRHRSPHHQ